MRATVALMALMIVLGLLAITQGGCGFNDPNMIPLDTGITDVGFCGEVVRFHQYKGTILVLMSDHSGSRAFYPIPREEEPRYLFRTLAVGDSLCKDAGSPVITLHRNGGIHSWVLSDPAYDDVGSE